MTIFAVQNFRKMNEEKRDLPPIIDHLVTAMEKSGVKIVFGLKAQGHIETIENELKRWNENLKSDFPESDANMMYSKHVWESIGKMIGWCPFTAALNYFEYLSESKYLPNHE
jgi:hypothetical protein